MVKNPIAFVFGAGVSHSYGYPLGIKLKNQIVERTRNSIINEDIKAGLDSEAFNVGEIKKFHNALRNSGTTSIDQFLSNNQRFLPIGKFYIALEIGSRQNIDALFKESSSDDPINTY